MDTELISPQIGVNGAGREWIRLDKVCSGVFDCPHTTPVLSQSGPFVVRSQDIRTGVFRSEDAARVSEETYYERIARAEPRHGDILYSREGTYFGIAAEVPANTKLCLGQRMVLIRPDPACLNSRYLRYWLNSPLMAGHVRGFRDGSVAERLNMPTIRNLPVLILPRPEQDAIGSVLGALDDKIELNRRMSETLEAMARALFRSWFVDFDPVHARAEGRATGLPDDLAALFPDSFGDDGIPIGWRLTPLSSLFSIYSGGTPKTSISEYWSGDIPWFSIADTPPSGTVFVLNTEKSISRIGLEQSPSQIVEAGTTIISARGTVGNLAMAGVPMTFNQSCYGLRGIGDVGDCFVFLGAQNMTAHLKMMSHGSVFSTITRDTFAAISLPLPSNAILLAFEKLAQPLFDKLKGLTAQVRTISDVRDILLPKLISGELRIADAEHRVAAA